MSVDIGGDGGVSRRTHTLKLLRRWILLAVVLGVPILLLVGVTNDPYNVPKFGLLTAGTGLALALRILDKPSIWRSGGVRAMAVPAGCVAIPMAASWLLSPYQEWSLFGSYARYLGLLPYLVVIVLGFLIADEFSDDATPILWTLTFAGAIVGGYAFMQILGVDPLARFFDNPPFTTATSTVGNTNFVGGFLAITLPIALVLWGTGDGVAKRIAMAATILIADGLVFSFSQAGYAAALAGTSVAIGGILQARWTKARVVGLFGAGLAALILVGIVVLGVLLPELGVGTTARIRGYWWESAIRMAWESPAFGRGPNSYAIEGPMYRSMEDVLTTPFETPDNPHSIFFSMLSGSGLFGLIGILLTIAWSLTRAVKASSRDPAALALAAAIAAYVVQGLVSVDVLTLRVAFWTCVGAVAAIASRSATRSGLAQAAKSPSRTNPRSAVVRGVVVGLAVAVAAGSTWWASGFVRADIRVRQGSELFEEQEVDEARRKYEQALAFREEREYRIMYGEQLGFAALDTRLESDELVTASRSQFEQIIDLPDYRALAIYARTLHYFGSFDRSYEHLALQLYERALDLNPFNPVLRVDATDTLLRLRRPEEVRPMLSVGGMLIGRQLPSVWASISMAHTLAGSYGDAQEALHEAESAGSGGCRTAVAQDLLQAHREPHEFAPTIEHLTRLRFICSRGEYQLLVDLVPADLRALYEEG